MAYDASEILGSPQVGGARVMAKGFVSRHVANQLNVVGGVAGAVSKLTVVFTDETRWELDVPKNGAKAAKEFAEAISL